MAQGCRIGRCFQVGSYLGYTGRDADVVAKAAFDPTLTLILHRSYGASAITGLLRIGRGVQFQSGENPG